MLGTLGSAPLALGPIFRLASPFRNQASDPDIAARLKKFLGETDARPHYGWFDLEDVLYHDQKFPAEIEVHPDIWVFGRQRVWVFNRAMEWRRDAKDGTILCYCPTGELTLTGDRQVSSWHSAPPNALEQAGAFTRFVKRSARQRDSAVLPAFQFHLGQNPVLELDVADADADWQFCISIKGRGGAPMLFSPWLRGPAKLAFNLEQELGKRGYELQYPELHFAIGLWTPNAADTAQIRFQLRMPSRAAVVAGLPAIRTAERARREGVPLAAAALSAKGELLGAGRARLVASVAGKRIPLTENGGAWKAVLHDLPIGDHEVVITSEGDIKASVKSVLRVTDGRFFKFDKTSRWVMKDGKQIGPLSGSYQGTFYFRDAGLPTERMVQGQKEWNEWDRKKAPGEHMHYWEAVTPRELDERFEFLAKNGFDLLTLHSHWGLWERLDAGGRIAPHAAEQLAMYLRTAGRHGLAHLQALSSGPYGVVDKTSGYGDTIPYSRYLEEGFQLENWFKPSGSRFDQLFRQYVTDFTTLFRDDTALIGMTASGEGDFCAPDRARDVFRQVREQDPNHIMFSEPMLGLDKLPEKICAPYSQDMVGGRTYGIATNEIMPEFDLGIEFKLFRSVNNGYMAEGSWPPMPSYTRFHFEVRKDDWGSQTCWTGTSMYRIRLRDTLYLGLVHRLPVMNTWDEEMAEDEHVLIKEIRDRVNWTQRFLEPQVAIMINDACAAVSNPARRNLARYEEAFVRMPLAYRIYTTADPPPGMLVSLDGRQPFAQPRFLSEGGTLPEELRQTMPLAISEPYCASYTQSEDKRTLLAYFYNTAEHIKEYQWLGGSYHRVPKPASFRIRVQNLASAQLRYRLYDLNEKRVVREIVGKQPPDWSLGATDHDYFLLVTPE